MSGDNEPIFEKPVRIIEINPNGKYIIECDQVLSEQVVARISETVKRWREGDATFLFLCPDMRLVQRPLDASSDE